MPKVSPDELYRRVSEPMPGQGRTFAEDEATIRWAMSLLDLADEYGCAPVHRALDHFAQHVRATPERHADAKPRSAAERRAGGKPAYIDPNCPVCGTPLVLGDRSNTAAVPDDEVWHDEWECPKCVDGVHIDAPASFWEKLHSKVRSGG